MRLKGVHGQRCKIRSGEAQRAKEGGNGPIWGSRNQRGTFLKKTSRAHLGRLSRGIPGSAGPRQLGRGQ